jgi:hypothetical protein
MLQGTNLRGRPIYLEDWPEISRSHLLSQLVSLSKVARRSRQRAQGEVRRINVYAVLDSTITIPHCMYKPNRTQVGRRLVAEKSK